MIAPAIKHAAEFDSIEAGHTTTLRREITSQAVDAFAAVSGDLNPLHMDDSYAQQLGFSGRVAHGVLLGSYVSALIGMQFPGPGAFWAKQTFEWRLPVFVGDVIEITATVKHKSAGTRTLLMSVQAKNQKGQIVMNGEGAVRLMVASR